MLHDTIKSYKIFTKFSNNKPSLTLVNFKYEADKDNSGMNVLFLKLLYNKDYLKVWWSMKLLPWLVNIHQVLYSWGY